MAKLLVHIATGPENPTRAALGLLVARTAVDGGHKVQIFLAGDGVHLARPATADATHGVGTGAVAEHWEALDAAGVPVHLSGMSSRARGIDAPFREGVELVQPDKLVELALWADTTLVY
jgi:predicted peroxiredoxin